MSTHIMTCAHPCPPMLFKLRPCIQKLCNVYYPPTPSLGWIGQIKGHSLSLAWARSASWLAYSLHLRSLTPIWSWMQGCTKLMPTHAHPWTITPHPCPPKTHGHGWAWAPNVGLCQEHKSVEILVFASPTSYMLWSFGISSLMWDIICTLF